MPGTRVVLHRVGRTTQGPLDSARADARGGFGFRFQADSHAVYLLSARHAGIEYFSEPVVPDSAGGAGVMVIVSDTSSSALVVVESRYLLAGAPGEEAARSVVDVVLLRNASGWTRVAADSGSPTWVMGRLPPSARIEEGTEFSLDAVLLRGDSLHVFAPISPGRRQIVLSYRVPLESDQLDLPVDAAVGAVTVLGEEPTLRVEGPRLREAEPERIEQRAIRRWTGSAERGDVIRLRFGRTPGPASPALVFGLVALVVTGLLAGLLFAGHRRVAPSRGPAAARSAAELLDDLARLDLRHQGRESELAADELASYQATRAELKRRLAAALAARRPDA